MARLEQRISIAGDPQTEEHLSDHNELHDGHNLRERESVVIPEKTGHIFTRHIGDFVPASAPASYWIFTAPVPMQIVQVNVAVQDSTGGTDTAVTANTTNYWTFTVRTYRTTSKTRDVAFKSTFTTDLLRRFAFRFEENDFETDATSIVQKGEYVGLVITKTGTPTDLMGLNITVRALEL